MAIWNMAALLVAILLLTGCSYRGAFLPERDAAPTIPGYPKAQTIVAQQDADGTGTIAFDTTDSPSIILGFYDKMIARQWNSWQPIYSKRPPTGSAPRTFIAQGCPFTFFLDIAATVPAQGATRVTLSIRKSPWCY